MRWASFLGFVLAQSSSTLIRWDTTVTHALMRVSFQVSAIPQTGYFIVLSSPKETPLWREEARILADAYAPKKLYEVEVSIKENFYYRLVYRSSREEVAYLTLCPQCEHTASPRIWLQKDTMGLFLSCVFPQAGQWVLRAFDRYGQEVFTYPIYIEDPGTRLYELPRLQGRYLFQIQDLKSQKVINELSLQL
ncbi:MAG: hypothetical protein ACUVRD_03480 [Bacteroidia bacterium]